MSLAPTPGLRRAFSAALALVLSAMAGTNASASTQSDELSRSFREGALVLTERGHEFYEDALFGVGNEFVVASILAVHDSGATQASPPRVTIRVERNLRGGLRRGVQVIEWLPAPLFMPCPMGERENIAAWERTPLRGPTTGRRLILSGRVGRSGQWGSDVWSRFADEPEVRRVVEERIRAWRPRHDAWLKQERAVTSARSGPP
ncbi:MAG: hypothetical protein ABIP29_04140 [Candidatus Eisenbacteria bacterium]